MMLNTVDSGLVIRGSSDVGETAFSTDALDRKAIADKLTNYVRQSGDGSVIAITAGWGDGKTWFGKNWQKALVDDELQKTFWLDVFESDFADDPFTAIAAEILRGTNSENPKSSELWDSTKRLGAKLLPGASKLAIAAAIKFTTGLTSDQASDTIDSVSDSAAEAAEKYVEKRIEEHQKAQQAISHFRTALAAYCKNEKKPVVFFIDELDRCRPDYAVKVIEQIKHFFDVPNLVFILLINREQLENSICGVYGSKIDAANYLGKFIHVFLTLPSAKGASRIWASHFQSYCKRVACSHGIVNSRAVNSFISTIFGASKLIPISLRDVQRIFTYVKLSGQMQGPSMLLAYLIILKLKRNVIFGMLQTDFRNGSEQAAKFANDLHAKNADFTFWRTLSIMHQLDSGVNANVFEGDSQVGKAESLRYELRELLSSLDLPNVEISY